MKVKGSDVKNRIFFVSVLTAAFLAEGAFAPGANLIFAASIVCGILSDDRKFVSAAALIAGAASDVLITPPSNISPILFFLGAYCASKTVGAFTSVNAASSAAASVPFFALKAAVKTIWLLSETDGVSAGTILKMSVLPEFAFNVTAVFFMYIAISFLYKRFKRRFYI